MLLFVIKLTMIAASTIYYSLSVLWLLALRKSGDVVYDEIVRWSAVLLRITGVKVDVSGLENLPDGESFVFMTNHSSLFDIPVFLCGIGRKTSIIYKKELEKVPIWGYALKKSPFISINRADAREAVSAMEEAARSLDEDASIMIFPEGTRSHDGRLGEFKRGAFMMAGFTGKRIVPVTLIGTAEILPRKKYFFKSGTVRFIVGSPREVPDKKDRLAEKALIAELHEEIKNNLE